MKKTLLKYTLSLREAITVKCEYCGNHTLIWDYARGEIVCPQCGTLQGRILTNDAPGLHVEHYNWRGNPASTNPTSRYRPITQGYKRLLRLYAVARKFKEKIWLEVDYGKLFSTGKPVKTVISLASMRARKNIMENNCWDTVNKGIKIIENINPALLARTERCKYALAYMIAKTIETNKIPSKKEITTIFNISHTTYRRLKKLTTQIKNKNNF